jgi:hypothetical protein
MILPPPSFFEISSSALQGVWSVVSDQSSRDLYESAITSHVIKDEVLSNASNGSVLIYSLFHNLYQDELFKDYKFDATEFVRAVGPALENFHDIIGRLQNDLAVKPNHSSADDQLQKQQEQQHKDLSNFNFAEAFLGENEWREKALKDPESLEACLSKMTTDACLDVSYYTSKIAVSFATASTSYMSCSVNEVALLSARAMVIHDDSDNNKTVGEFEEFRATEELGKELNVGAQIDVLYEITSTLKTFSDEENPKKEETITTTNLAVAIFEGWLSGGPEKQLRWKIAALREASEFPHTPTIERQ